MTVPPNEQPDLRWLSDRVYLLRSDFVYHDHDDITITVPAGFLSDGPSIPQQIAWLVEQSDLSPAAALLHDFLYRHIGTPPGIQPSTACYTRFGVDSLFDEINQRHGVVAWKRRLAYAAVRTFGWVAWRKR